ncbi:MAG: hydrogenase maturation protease [Thaumarchaeota archaeon]|nr:hydrogenase maturation protease [Nitrososphaerota archaeon]
MKDCATEVRDNPSPGTDGSTAGSGSGEAEGEPWGVSFEGKTVVVGLGNPYMRDDGVGIRAARTLRGLLLGDLVCVYEAQGVDLSLLWQFKGARKVIVIDAVRSGGHPGTVTRHVIAPKDEPMSRLPSLHALELYDLFDLAAEGELLPCPVVIIGVEPDDCSPGEELTSALTDALPKVVQAAIEELRAGSSVP